MPFLIDKSAIFSPTSLADCTLLPFDLILLSSVEVAAATSTLDKSIKSKGRSVQSAKEVGEKIADLSIKNGIKKVIFDRSGYRYHGRIKMIAEAAREKGLEI